MCDLVDEERVLVEMACGAALAAVYSGVIRRLQDEGNCCKVIIMLIEIHQPGSVRHLLKHLLYVGKSIS